MKRIAQALKPQVAAAAGAKTNLTEPKCRVLVVSPKPLSDYAGWLRQTLTMIRACNTDELWFTWLCPRSGGKPDVETTEHFAVRRIDAPRGTTGRLSRLAFGLKVARYLVHERASYDVVYCPWAYTPTDLVTMTAALVDKPSVARVAQGELSLKSLGGRVRRRLLSRTATALIVLNRSLYDDAAKLAGDKVRWHPNGVDTSMFHPRGAEQSVDARRRWGLPEGRRLILFVGSIVPRKGLDTLMAAFAELNEEAPNSHLCLAGPTNSARSSVGELRTSFVRDLKAFVQQHGLEETVTFLGRVSEVPQLMRAADVFVLPSLAEGMPNVLLEAMATGLPCVGSDIPGVRELITHGENGMLFPPGNVSVLRDRVAWLLGQPAERQRLGSRARESIEAEYSIQKTGRRYQELFLELGSPSSDPH